MFYEDLKRISDTLHEHIHNAMHSQYTDHRIKNPIDIYDEFPDWLPGLIESVCKEFNLKCEHSIVKRRFGPAKYRKTTNVERYTITDGKHEFVFEYTESYMKCSLCREYCLFDGYSSPFEWISALCSMIK